VVKKRSRAYDTSKPLLAVYMHGYRIGALGQADSDVWFKYDPAVLDTADVQRMQLSVKLPITDETYGHEPTLVFFDNLLLESDTRQALAAATKSDPSDIPGLLGRVGGECAGAVSLWPIGVTPPLEPSYRDISRDELELIFSDRYGERLTKLQLESRQSMSGVQHKLVFARSNAGYQLPLNGAPSSVILKRTTGRYEQFAANEHACMLLFAEVGLPTPQTTVLDGANGLLEARRFDRVALGGGGGITRLHQEDFCQASGRRLAAKYQWNNGPGFADLARIIRRYSVTAARDIEHLVRAAVANVCVGNMDAHAKNYALLTDSDGQKLAPFYDIVCTEVYPNLDAELSMNFGTTRNPSAISHVDIKRLAKDVMVHPGVITDEIERVTSILQEQRRAVFHRVTQEVGDASILDQIDAIIEQRCQRMRNASAAA
jgi:serine/threonine-protein kinase HipA